ncbi:MAG: phytanoyl-CoA dioxygenase family protein [Sphingobium sp.]
MVNALQQRYAPESGDYLKGISQEPSSLPQAAAAIWEEIVRLGLERNIAELEVLGYTIIPPDRAAPAGFTDALLARIIDIARRRHGLVIDLAGTRALDGQESGFGFHLSYLLQEDALFQQAVLNPHVLALTDYLLGRNAVLSNCLALLKGRGETMLDLHCDNVMVSAPFPPHDLVANATWALTDYSRENGALCFVPGSHKEYRHPRPGESMDERVVVEAPAGSLIFWGGRVWHGALARSAPGVRVNLITALMRPFLRPQEPYREDVDQALLDRNPPRLATLLGQDISYGWREEGPQGGASANVAGRHAFD